MAIREKLLEISELNIAKRLIQMGDYEFNEYIQILNSFVEKFPAQEMNIKKALEEKDYLSFSKNFIAIKDLLVQIHADSLVDDCMKQINELSSVNHEKIEAFMTQFLTVLTMLSIDIQVATLIKNDSWEKKRLVKNTKKLATKEKSILAVDDNAFFLEIMKGILRGTEYKLTCVISSRDALKFLQNHQPDLFILDIEMPQLNGYDLARKIREREQAAPIIFLTANATRENFIRAIDAGAVDFIVKPPNNKYVLEKIAKYI
jgi:CheY-like chemotaxis protein